MIAALALAWSLHLDTGLRIADAGVQSHWRETTLVTHEQFGIVRVADRSERLVFSDRAANPYGTLRLTLEVELNERWSLLADGLHQSSVATGADRGVNSVGVWLRCRLGGSRR